MDTWCCRVASLDVGSAHGLVLHSLFALWPRGISFGPGHRWALELHSRALWYPVSAWLGSWWHEKRQIDASPARVTLIRERAAQSADHLAEKRQNGLLWVRWSAIWANPETRQTRPPTTATFPRNTADKSPPQQHDVSSLRLIGHVVLLWFAPCAPWYALLVRTWAYYSESGLSHPHVDPLFRVWATPPTYGTAG